LDRPHDGGEGRLSRFVQRKVNGEPYVYLYFKERPDSAVVACGRDDSWPLGVLQVDGFRSVVGKTLEFNGEVVNGTCSGEGRRTLDLAAKQCPDRGRSNPLAYGCLRRFSPVRQAGHERHGRPRRS
jgi:hypothetical protein